MVGSLEFGANLMAEIVVLLVVQNVVDSVGGEHLASVGGAGAFAAASERVFKPVGNLVVTERGG